MSDPLDYNRLTSAQQLAMGFIDTTELSLPTQHNIPATKATLATLVKKGWLECYEEWLEERRYDDVVWHDACYWMTESATEAMERHWTALEAQP